MIKKIFFLLVFTAISATAQYTLSGEFIPPGKAEWVILYRIENAKGLFVENADVIDGKFKLSLKNDAAPGIYRLLFQSEKQEFADIIFNKKNIRFSLDPDDPDRTIEFQDSDENSIYRKYLKKIHKEQYKLDSIQQLFFKDQNSDISNAYRKKLQNLNRIQEIFEKKTEDKLTGHFIKAEKVFNSKIPASSAQAHLNTLRDHYFDYLDFSDSILYRSTIIHDKLIDYIFRLNSAKSLEKTEILQKFAIDRAVHLVRDRLSFLQELEKSIIRIYMKENHPKMARYVLEKYYLKLPEQYIDPVFKETILGDLKTSVGSKSPDLKWIDKNGKANSLYRLKNKQFYIIVFFSSGCSHCQEQMPVFYNIVKNMTHVQVITIGLEDEKDWWQNMTSKWKEFINILDLKKWESNRVHDFGVTAIPSFFILDKNKIIIAKPDDVTELKKTFGMR